MADLGSQEVLDLINQYTICNDTKKQKILKQKIAASCLPEVKKLARSLARRNTDPIEDLIQVGCVGLLKAIDHYTKGHKTSFKTYATYFITGEIKHYLRDKVSMVKAPRELYELAFRMNQVTEQLFHELGRKPTTDEVAQRLSLPVAKVREAAQADRRNTTVSLDNNLNFFNSDSTLENFLVDNNYQDVLVKREEKIELLDAIDKLQEPYKDTIKMSFFQNMNQKQIAAEMNISQMQVSRRIKKAISMLAVILTEQWGNELD